MGREINQLKASLDSLAELSADSSEAREIRQRIRDRLEELKRFYPKMTYDESRLVKRRLVLMICAACALPACERFGYSNRVLLRVPSPDGRIVAVCQEIPEFDRPSFDVRAERPDGTRIRQLLRSGDGDPCSELAWSPDGRLLAVLSRHVDARARGRRGEDARGPAAASKPLGRGGSSICPRRTICAWEDGCSSSTGSKSR